MSDSPQALVPPAFERDHAAGTAPTAGGGWFVALVAVTLLVCFHDLAGGAHFETTDCWVAQTAREMRERGEWVVPYFSGEKRMQKSPGPYWAVMLASVARGAPVDEASARVPSAIAASALVISIYLFAKRIAGPRAAVFAGFATASSALILHWSHRAASDLGVATLTTASLFLVWLAANEPGRGRRLALWLSAYFVAGLGMLYKMPMPLVCVGLPAICYVVFCRRWGALADWSHALGLIVFCLPWLPWAVAVYYAEPTALLKWRVEFLDRATGELPNVKGQNAWPFLFFYLIPLAVYTLPYVVSIPGALARPFMRRAGEDRDAKLFLLIWFVSHFAFFTASVGKETRYFLPALPPLFVLLGCDLSELFANVSRWSLRTVRLGAALLWTVVGLGLVGGGVALNKWAKLTGMFEWNDVRAAYVAIAAAVAVGTGVAGAFLWRRRGDAVFASAVATMLAVFFVGWSWLMPVVASQKPFTDFAAQLREKIPPADVPRMRHLGFQDSRITWYSDYRVRRLIDQLELLKLEGGNRSLANEMRLIGEALVRRMNDEPASLFTCTLEEFALFKVAAPRLCSRLGIPEPPAHLWLQARYGAPDRQYVLFSPTPPAWAAPKFEISDKIRERLRARVDEIESAVTNGVGEERGQRAASGDAPRQSSPSASSAVTAPLEAPTTTRAAP